jgi:integrase
MAKRRGNSEGNIEKRGENVYRLRYRVDGRRFKVTFKGSLAEARKKLTSLLDTVNKGEHIDPAKVTLKTWVEQWLGLLERNPDQRRRGLINARTLERYDQLLKLHVVPTLGAVALQKLTATGIDNLYIELERKLAVRTVRHVHVTLKACLASAVRKRLISRNPAEDVEAPKPGNANIANVLDENQLTTLVRGFHGHPLEGIVTVAALTGARRNEILALQWGDIDFERKTLSITRAMEETKKHGRHVKEPKSERGRRIIAVGDALINKLRQYRDQQRRLQAGIPEEIDVDLSLVTLPTDALVFPGEGTDLTKLRDAHAVTRTFVRLARKLGFKMRFHDIRASHLTILLDRGIGVHTVAARAGHDANVLLSSYARWTKKSDTTAAEVIGNFSKGMI